MADNYLEAGFRALANCPEWRRAAPLLRIHVADTLSSDSEISKDTLRGMLRVVDFLDAFNQNRVPDVSWDPSQVDLPSNGNES